MNYRLTHPCPPPLHEWWVARDEEGPFEPTGTTNREDAIAEAIGQGCYEELDPPEDETEPLAEAGIWLMWARRRHVNLALWFEADEWLERVSEDACDEYGSDEDGKNGWWEEISPADMNDLNHCIRSAIWHWQHRRQKPLRAYYLDGNPSEFVVVPLPMEDK